MAGHIDQTSFLKKIHFWNFRGRLSARSIVQCQGSSMKELDFEDIQKSFIITSNIARLKIFISKQKHKARLSDFVDPSLAVIEVL